MKLDDVNKKLDMQLEEGIKSEMNEDSTDWDTGKKVNFDASKTAKKILIDILKTPEQLEMVVDPDTIEDDYDLPELTQKEIDNLYKTLYKMAKKLVPFVKNL
jgi:hypothetical protein